MVIRAHFKGQEGQYYGGIPARDLTDEDFDLLDDEQKELVRSSSSLYRYVPYTQQERDTPKPQRGTPTAPPEVPNTETTEEGK